jgi:hypothetical protein
VHCPDLIYPLLERGASLAEFGPDGLLPCTIDIDVFRDARWKLLRTLYLLNGRGCLPMPNHLLGFVGAFLAEPLYLTRGSLPQEMERQPFALSLGPLDMYNLCSPPPFPSLSPPPFALLSD